MKKLKVSVLVIGISLGFTELLLRIFYEDPRPKPLFDVSLVKSVRQSTWYPRWNEEHKQLKRTFRAYEIFGLRPFEGKEIQITEDGYRRTLNAGPSENRIGMFGGSTMWGGMSRDSKTIPSELSRAFRDRGKRIEVINYGQVGFVFSQEVHQALRIMYSNGPSERPTPQTMVFLDGVCDVLAALGNLVKAVPDPAGKPWEYEKYEYLFQLGKTGEVSFGDIAKKSKLVRSLLRVAESRGWKSPEKKNVFIVPTEGDRKKLALEVADKYVSLLTVAHKALTANGVRPIFILQPAIFEKNQLSAEEQVVFAKNKSWQKYVSEAYQHIKEKAARFPGEVEFWDFSQLFKDDPRTLYADVMHYSDAGNKVIAEKIHSRLLESPPIKDGSNVL